MGLLSELRGNAHDVGILLAFDLLPLVPIALFHARKTYQALSAGYTLRDLRAALAAWQQERRDELAFELDEAESKWARIMRSLTYALVGGVGLFFFVGLPHNRTGVIMLASTIAAVTITITLNNALGVRMISRRIRPKLIGALRSMILNSRLGEWAVRLLTPKKRKGTAELGYRPTEMALGLAVEELFGALPKAYRESLGDLPAVVQRLEAHAAAARARVEEVDALLSAGGAPGAPAGASRLTVARDAAKRELADSVASLEAVRLDLLRLHGGAQDLRPITTVLDAARALGEELDRLVQADREVGKLAARPLPFELRPHTPL
jgi:eukaryotic-like serine/threonine-protein kinase